MKKDHPGLPRARPLLLLAALAALGWLAWPRGERPLEVELRGVDEARRAQASTGGALLRPPGPAPESSVLGAAGEEAAQETRTPAVRTIVEGARPPAEVPLAVYGIVLDELGEPLPHARVTYVPYVTLEDPGTGANGLQPGRSDVRIPSRTWETRSSPGGRFELAGTNARNGGFLEFARNLYHGPPPRQAVLRDGGEQVLQLPEPAVDSPTVRVELVDEAGNPLLASRWLLDLVRPAPGERVRRQPNPRRVYAGNGSLELGRLGPGTWDLRVRAEGAGWRRCELDVPAAGPDVLETLVFRAGTGAWREEHPSASPSGFRNWLDPSSGITEWAPERIRGFLALESNAHFAHTLHGFGTGPVLEATLELRLMAVPDMPNNDSISLEYYRHPSDDERPHRFRWTGRIAELCGKGRWRVEDRAHLLLDLGALPTPEGTTSLLRDLEDGLLDVVIQDDTCVADLRLSVLRE